MAHLLSRCARLLTRIGTQQPPRAGALATLASRAARGTMGTDDAAPKASHLACASPPDRPPPAALAAPARSALPAAFANPQARLMRGQAEETAGGAVALREAPEALGVRRG